MKIFNTLSRTKEEFIPLEEGKVKMYVCGPTVYNFIHIGNARPMIVFDTVRRYFEYKGYEVNFVSNFTDVDDKIIKKAIEEGVDADTISQRYIAECKKDMQGMNVKPATVHPQATQEICGMLDMIGDLIEKGHAYVAKDGTVYFRTGSFKEYGKLSHKNLEDLRSGFRELKVTGAEEELAAEVKGFVGKYEAAMDDDFNTADAIAAVFELVKLGNSTSSGESSREYLTLVKETIERLCDVLGIITETKKEALDSEIEEMIAMRQQARKDKNFALADEIRGKLLSMGILLEDTREGVKWKRA